MRLGKEQAGLGFWSRQVMVGSVGVRNWKRAGEIRKRAGGIRILELAGDD